MSTFILMKILESAPSRYDLGIRLLTLGRLDRAYDRLVLYIGEGQRVLDIGCGTGALTVRATQRGAWVVGVDLNARMLDVARQRVATAGQILNFELREMGVAELDGEPASGYDAVMSGLCLSELSDDERVFALRQAHRLLKPGGLLLVADEVIPRGFLKRLLHWCVRLPLAFLTYLFTQTSTRAVRRLPEDVRSAGFDVESIRLNALENLIELVARRPANSP